jgi:hypothetical protein
MSETTPKPAPPVRVAVPEATIKPDPNAPAPPRVMGLGARNNIWRVKVLDGDNRPVQNDKGETTVILRGPASRAELIRSAEILFNSKRNDALLAGLGDPGYHIDLESIEPLGHSDADLGQWKPEGARQLNLPTDPAVRAQHEKLINEKLAARGENA